jgi:hypothetical protein
MDAVEGEEGTAFLTLPGIIAERRERNVFVTHLFFKTY